VSACSGVAITGALLDATGSWPLALFAPSAFFFVTGITVFTAFGSSDLQDFAGADAGPFWCAFACGWRLVRGFAGLTQTLSWCAVC
jgi:hypothetical protein